MRVLSGIQPSGRLHIGNYLGALRQYLALQEDGNDCYFFIANYHALTSIGSARELEEASLHVAMAFVALGLDPDPGSIPLPPSPEAHLHASITVDGVPAAILGPALMGLVTLATGNHRIGIASLLIFFIAGGLLLIRVKPAS